MFFPDIPQTLSLSETCLDPQFPLLQVDDPAGLPILVRGHGHLHVHVPLRQDRGHLCHRLAPGVRRSM